MKTKNNTRFSPVTGAFGILLMSLFVTTHAFSASLLLDFGTTTQDTFSTTGVMTYSAVATGINARISATSGVPYTASNPTNNGSATGDIRVNAGVGSNIRMTLQLFDSTVGDGFTAFYNPGVNYDWNFVFYDIDRNHANFDEVTVYTPGIYTVTSNTDLSISSGTGFTTFSGQFTTGDVPGQDGLTSFTAAQADVAFGYKITNLNSIDFSYRVGDLGPNIGGRSLLIDANDLALAFEDFDPVVTVVPEPSSLAFLFASSALLLKRRRKQ